MSEMRDSFERNVSGQAPPFILGKCSLCGGRAQRRINSETWFHVDMYDEWTIHRPVVCPKGGEDSLFVQEKSRSRRKNFEVVEPHYREILDEIMDYDAVDENGKPAPALKTIRRPIVCTCTNKECPGWGTPLPDEIKKLRSET